MLRNLPENVEVLSCFSQFVKFHRHGIKNQTDDYSCFVTGPGEYFQKIEGFCRERNVPVLAKTEVSQGQEFVSTSYIPVLTQHQRRWDALLNIICPALWAIISTGVFSPPPVLR